MGLKSRETWSALQYGITTAFEFLVKQTIFTNNRKNHQFWSFWPSNGAHFARYIFHTTNVYMKLTWQSKIFTRINTNLTLRTLNNSTKFYRWTQLIGTFRGNSRKFFISRVRYIESFCKVLVSQGEQTLFRYIECSYYRGLVLSSFYCR